MVVPDAYAGEAGAVFADAAADGHPSKVVGDVQGAVPPERDVLRVTPIHTRIPHSQVQFRPNADGQYYAQTLEAFCSFKSMRTFRLVTEESFALPWCLSLSACGHTFAPGGEHFIPKSLLSHRRLTFPACHAGDAAYQTVSLKTDSNTQRPPSLSPPLTPLLPPYMSNQVSLKNDGDTPMLFSVTQDASGSSRFSLARASSPAAPRSSCRPLRPSKVESYHKVAQLVLNTGAAPVPIELHGAGCKASPDHGTWRHLHLPTTCVGSASTATLKLTNPSRMAVAYEWDIPAKLEVRRRPEPALFLVPCLPLSTAHPAPSPSTGHVDGRPPLRSAARPRVRHSHLAVRARQGRSIPDEGPLSGLPSGRESRRLDLRRRKQLLTCTGVGATGELRAEPSVLDFGSVLVGDSERRTLSLINPTAVALYYSSPSSRTTAAPAILAGGDGEMPLLTMEEGMTTGVVPARNSVNIHGDDAAAALSPFVLRAGRPPRRRRRPRRLHRLPRLRFEALSDEQTICEVKGSGEFPLLQIVDARLPSMAKNSCGVSCDCRR